MPEATAVVCEGTRNRPCVRGTFRPLPGVGAVRLSLLGAMLEQLHHAELFTEWITEEEEEERNEGCAEQVGWGA